MSRERIVAGPIEPRASISPIAHEWPASTSRVEKARRRIASFHALAATGDLDLADDELDDPVEDRVLVGHVLVQRHGLDAELGAQAAHRQGAQSLAIGHGNRRAQDPVLRQRRAGVGFHMDKLTK